jgi:hypothetical protein
MIGNTQTNIFSKIETSSWDYLKEKQSLGNFVILFILSTEENKGSSPGSSEKT